MKRRVITREAWRLRPGKRNGTASLLVAAALASWLGGCGGDGVSGPPTPAPSPVPVTVVVDQGSVSDLGPGRVVWGGFTTGRTGDVEVIVDWTSPANNLDLFLTRGTCNPEQLLAGTCIVLGTAESPTAKPERIRVSRAVDGLFTLFVVNLGPAAESFSYQFLLTYTPVAASKGQPRQAVRLR